jgi:hypothetical protein
MKKIIRDSDAAYAFIRRRARYPKSLAAAAATEQWRSQARRFHPLTT